MAEGKSLMDRPARKQADRVQGQDGFDDGGGSDYNIWHHKRSGKRKDRDSAASTSKCEVLQDSGKTRAGKNEYFCIHFARGKCVQGPNCAFQHRIPEADDEVRVQKDQSTDCFGRDRHEAYRDDMKGAGSYNRENKSIMINGLRMDKLVEAAIRTAFAEYGPVERVYVVADKAIAFVKWSDIIDKWRSSAEFGKEALDGQLINGNTITTKWAHEDPNPGQKHREQVQLHKRAEEAVAKRLRAMTGQEQAALSYELTGQYPNTDANYPTNNYYQYPNNTNYYNQNSYSSYPNTDSQYPNTNNQYPNTNDQYLNTNDQYPNTDYQYPNTDSQYSTCQYPNTDLRYTKLVINNQNSSSLESKQTQPSSTPIPINNNSNNKNNESKETSKKPVVSDGLLAIGDYGDEDDE